MLAEIPGAAIYGVAGIVLALLIVWYLRRRRSSRVEQTATDVAVHESQDAETSAPPATAISKTETTMPTVPTVAARAKNDDAWEDRKLFHGFSHAKMANTDALPRVESHEVPFADKTDLLFGPLTNMLASLLPESAERQQTLAKDLSTAGYYRPHARYNLAAIRYLAVMLPLIFFGGLLLFVPAEAELGVILTMVITAGLGWALPSLYVRNKAAARTSEIEGAMPDMLDMLHMCVSQGLTVTQSLTRISHELRDVYPALSRELDIVSEQAEIGGIVVALENFSARIDMAEVHSFTSLLIQTERMGTSVSAALTDYSDNIRESLRQRADEKANQATFKLLFPTVLCLMPAVYMFLLGPAIIELSDFFNEGGRDVLDAGRQAVDQLNR
jgi:tight adherence protein C